MDAKAITPSRLASFSCLEAIASAVVEPITKNWDYLAEAPFNDFVRRNGRRLILDDLVDTRREIARLQVEILRNLEI
jgi:hypothetical protein